MTSPLDVRPYFKEDIAAAIQSAYFLCANMKDGLGAARLATSLCIGYGIKPDFIKPEHIQALQMEFR